MPTEIKSKFLSIKFKAMEPHVCCFSPTAPVSSSKYSLFYLNLRCTGCCSSSRPLLFLPPRLCYYNLTFYNNSSSSYLLRLYSSFTVWLKCYPFHKELPNHSSLKSSSPSVNSAFWKYHLYINFVYILIVLGQWCYYLFYLLIMLLSLSKAFQFR